MHKNALWLVLLVSACSIAPPDRTGKIRAGNAGENSCPPGFLVRWGRCCPTDSTAAQCPLEVERDPTGLQYEPLSCTCPTGTVQRGNVCCPNNGLPTCSGAERMQLTGCTCPANHELRFGKCCPLDSGRECPAGEIGSPCMVNEDCRLPIGAANNLSPLCLQNTDLRNIGFQAPNGYCAVNGCNNDAACGPNAVCLRVFLNLAGYCARACPSPNNTTSLVVCPQSGSSLVCYHDDPDLTTPGRLDFCNVDCTVTPGACGAGYGCDPVTHGCSRQCTNNAECLLNGFARCDTAAGFCRF